MRARARALSLSLSLALRAAALAILRAFPLCEADLTRTAVIKGEARTPESHVARWIFGKSDRTAEDRAALR